MQFILDHAKTFPSGTEYTFDYAQPLLPDKKCIFNNAKPVPYGTKCIFDHAQPLLPDTECMLVYLLPVLYGKKNTAYENMLGAIGK